MFLRQEENKNTRNSVIFNLYLQLKSRLEKFMPLCKNREAHKTQCINVREGDKTFALTKHENVV